MQQGKYLLIIKMHEFEKINFKKFTKNALYTIKNTCKIIDPQDFMKLATCFVNSFRKNFSIYLAEEFCYL